MADATIIDGKAFAAVLRKKIAAEVNRVQDLHDLSPGLSVVLVGDDAASQVYVRNKIKMTEEVGIRSSEHRLPSDIKEEELLTLVRGLNKDSNVHGILVQLPIPDHINPDSVITEISPDKDVDGFHAINAGRLAIGDPRAMVPCTPTGCLMLIKNHLGDLSGKRALVLGRSNIVGKPMAALLLSENCTVTIAHSKTKELKKECSRADILVAAVGREKMVKGDWIKPGATVIDVGINRVEIEDEAAGTIKSKLTGDVDYDEAVKVAGAITPVPGGVGPMTIACLLRNTLIAACRQNRIEEPDI